MTADALGLARKVISQCDAIGECSSDSNQITRLYLTEPMRAVHIRLSEWMHQAGLAPRIDNAGNCIGRLRSETGDRVLLIGSHLDSVPNAGRYDGVLGTLLGVAVCEWLREKQLPFHLDVIGFSEEEGVRFKMPYLGSTAVAGQFQPSWLDRTDCDQVTMRDAMQAFGLSPENMTDCCYDPSAVIGYIEPHLEQGPVLEETGHPLGVVTGIAGQTRMRMTFDGEAGHAGTAPMAGRRDALVAAADFVRQVRAKAKSVSGLKATVGTLKVMPNTPNVIPGRVELSVDVRHLEDATRKQAVHSLVEVAEKSARAENCGFELLESNSQDTVRADQNLMTVLADSIAASGQSVFHLESGAGHDAVIMGQRFPMSMLFLRHPGGISHHPDEKVEVDDVAVAIEVLGRYVLKLADQNRTTSNS